jgi:multidrug/hemolysin transport system permease protein
MIAFAKRNIKLFFRDKSAVFFSLLSVFIIISLYALFLGDVWTNNLTEISNARALIDCWIMAGLIAVTSVTTTMGSFGILVDDKARKISKDFYSSPVKRSHLVAGYVISSFIVGVLMSIVAFILAQIYLLIGSGGMLSITAIIKSFGLILLSTFTNTAIVLFAVSFFKSQNAFATASTVIGTLIGFLTGIYLPIGNLSGLIQGIIKLFPVSHAVLLFRQVLMEEQLSIAFGHAPEQYLTDFNEMMGVTFSFGDYTLTPLVSIIILIITGLLFYSLSIWNLSRKNK